MFRNSIVYNQFFSCFSDGNRDKERDIQEHMLRLRDTTPESMRIKPQYCLTNSTVKWFIEKHNYSPQADLEPPS